MKKIKLVLVMVLALGMIMSGCGEKVELTSNEKQPWAEADVKTLATYIVENTEFEDYMEVVNNDILYGLYNLEETVVEDAVLYASTGATAEEVAVIKATNGNGSKLEEAVRSRIEAQKQGFENYVPKELKKLEAPIVMIEDDMVVFVVCDDSEAAKELISNYANEEI